MEMADRLECFLDGDIALIAEIKKNAKSFITVGAIVTHDQDIGVFDYMTRYTFEKDEAGNWVIPGCVFGGTQNVRVKANKKNEIVIEVVQAIMAITNRDRNAACQIWRTFSDDIKTLIRNGLHKSEGMMHINICQLFYMNMYP